MKERKQEEDKGKETRGNKKRMKNIKQEENEGKEIRRG